MEKLEPDLFVSLVILMGEGEEIELSEKSDNVWMYATAGTPNGVLLDVMCGGDE